jgi:hypothetical protein
MDGERADFEGIMFLACRTVYVFFVQSGTSIVSWTKKLFFFFFFFFFFRAPCRFRPYSSTMQAAFPAC